jgi:hypothetical protein
MEAFSAASGEEWEERPVDLDTFVTSEDFLNFPPLSDHQHEAILAGTQIYKEDTLINLYGQRKGRERFKDTCNEVTLAWGKGSGKDACSVIMCVYVAYLLMCLKDPAKYYGKPNGDNIDIMNIAVNAQQANRVFFKNLVLRVQQCPWFYGKYSVKNGEINFDKNINVISGHSESESLEGYNVIMVVLDEISGFALESNTGNDRAKTAQFVYDMHRGSVDSRFEEFGKVVLLSFTRFKGDFISQKYEEAIAEKETIEREHTFKIVDDLPDGTEGNELKITWEEDIITRYAIPNYYAQRRPTWEVNPTKTLDGLKRAFFTNTPDAMCRFACQPTDSGDDTFIKDKQAIEESFISMNGVDNDGIFNVNFLPKQDMDYYIHVDLSKVHDRCAVAMAHVDKWVTDGVGLATDVYPFVRIDAIRWWKPSKDKPMDYKEVTDYILSLRNKGFNVKTVSFDRWNSHDTMNFLEGRGINTEMLSVANKHYDDFLNVLYSQRLVGPKIPELVTELRELRYIKDKIDHPRSGYKDLSDAMTGAIWNAINYTKKPMNKTVEIVTFKSIMRDQEAEEQRQQVDKSAQIRPPKRSVMPEEYAREMDRISMSTIKLI